MNHPPTKRMVAPVTLITATIAARPPLEFITALYAIFLPPGYDQCAVILTGVSNKFSASGSVIWPCNPNNAFSSNNNSNVVPRSLHTQCQYGFLGRQIPPFGLHMTERNFVKMNVKRVEWREGTREVTFCKALSAP